jgi:large subunit ribosomal protein L28
MFRPNIQTVHTVIDGTPKRISACTSCIKKGKVQRQARV